MAAIIYSNDLPACNIVETYLVNNYLLNAFITLQLCAKNL